jgi:hypothetical protein
MQTMEQHAFKKCKQLFEYSDYLEISDGQSSNLYLNVVHFSTAMLIRHLRLLKTVVFLHWCPIRALLLLEYQSHILVRSIFVFIKHFLRTKFIMNFNKLILSDTSTLVYYL